MKKEANNYKFIANLMHRIELTVKIFDLNSNLYSVLVNSQETLLTLELNSLIMEE